MRHAMLVDIMWPLLSILEANQDAPVREAIAWELQLADGGTDATLRDAYADRLHEWGCAKREADVRKEAGRIRAGETIAPRRAGGPLVLRYPPGDVNVGTDDGCAAAGSGARRGVIAMFEQRKECRRCKLTKPVADFCRNGMSLGGYHHFCRTCERARVLENRVKRAAERASAVAPLIVVKRASEGE